MAGKKRADGEGTIVQRANGSFGAAISVQLAGGKRGRKWVYAKTRKEVAEKLAALKQEMAEYGDTVKKVTVGAFMQSWLEMVVRGRNKPQTYQRYASLTKKHVIPNIGHIQLSHLTAEHVQTMLNKLAKKLKRNSVTSVRGALHRAINQAIRWGHVRHNVVHYTDIPGQKTYSSGKAFSAEEASTFLKAIEGHPLEALFYLAVTRGLRRGELLGLRWQDVNFNEQYLRVVNTLMWDNKYVLGALKTAAGNRILPLSDKHISLLGAVMAQQQAAMGKRWKDTTYVFSRADGTPLRPRYMHDHFKKILEKANLREIRLHDLRHTCGTRLAEEGVDPRTIADVLGHSTVNITLTTYTHPSLQQRRKALAQLEQALL